MEDNRRTSPEHQIAVANRLLKNPLQRLVAKTALKISNIPGMRKLFCYDLVGGHQKGFLLNIGAHVNSQVGGTIQLAGRVKNDQRNIIGLQYAGQVGGSQSQYIGMQCASNIQETQAQGAGIQHVGEVKKGQVQGIGFQTSKKVGFSQMQGAGCQITGKCDGQDQVLGIQSFKESTGINHHFLGGIILAGQGSVEPGFVCPSVIIQDREVVSI